MSTKMTTDNEPKPKDLKLSSQFTNLIPEAALYHSLVESERRIDALLTRKKLDLQDSLSNRGLSATGGARKKQVMRIFVSNSVQDQAWQRMDALDGRDFDFGIGGGVPASWTLRIEGRLLGDDKKLDDPTRRVFSSYFTGISVEFENDEYGGSETHVAEWHETPVVPNAQPTEFDVLDIRRKGSRALKAKITLQPKQYPTKLTVSEPLRELLGLEREETRASVVLALWKYVKFHNLQDLEEKRVVRCDLPLKNLFSASVQPNGAVIDKFLFPQIVQLLEPHLSPPKPLVLDYTIQVNKETNIGENVWDIEIEVEDETHKNETKELLKNWDDSKSINELDEQIAKTIQILNSGRLKHKFFQDLAQNPSETIQTWLDSQASDLRIIMSDKGFNEEQVRHSDFYTDEVLNQSVHLFLNNNRR